MEKTVIERAARALSKCIYESEKQWEDCVDDVRAVLLAIREPDEAMTEAGFRAPERGMNLGQSATATWSAMIDAALA